jgi:hypothetical protein
MDRILDTLTEQSHVTNTEKPWLTASAAELDKKSFGEWLAEHHPTELASSAMETEFSSDNGVPLAGQSLLGMMAAIKGGGLEKFWTDSELDFPHFTRRGTESPRIVLASAREFPPPRTDAGTWKNPAVSKARAVRPRSHR